MRPLKRKDPGHSYLLPSTITVASRTTKAILTGAGIKPSDGNSLFSLQTFLDFLTEQTMARKGAGTWDSRGDEGKAVVAIMRIFTDYQDVKYQRARGPLILNFGEQCAYCEMMVYDSSLAVEHILPKDQFPAEMLYYENFFLSCPVCNSHKLDQPNYGQCGEFFENYVNPGSKPTSYNQYIDAGQKIATWPTFDDAFNGFSLDVFNFTTPGFLSWPEASNSGNRYLGTESNQIVAFIVGKMEIRVGSVFREVNKDRLVNKQRENSIRYADINQSGEGERYTDRRMENRTRVWFQALATINRLQALAQNTTKPVYELFMGQVIETVKSSGFFSTWAFFFKQASSRFNEYNPYNVLCKLVTNEDEPAFYIPGTNKDGLQPF